MAALPLPLITHTIFFSRYRLPTNIRVWSMGNTYSAPTHTLPKGFYSKGTPWGMVGCAFIVFVHTTDNDVIPVGYIDGRVRRRHLGLHIDLFRAIFYCHFFIQSFDASPDTCHILRPPTLYEARFPRDKPSISCFITCIFHPFHIGTTFTASPKTIRRTFFSRKSVTSEFWGGAGS